MKHPILKYSLFFGSLAAACCIAVALIQYYTLHVCPFGRYKAPAYGINVIFIFVAIWYYRINRGGFLSFGEGFAIGFLTNIFAAILTGFVLYIFVQFVDNQPITLWIQENLITMQRMKEVHIKQFGEESFKQILAQSQQINNSAVFFDEITKKQLCIVAVSLISVILRRHPATNS